MLALVVVIILATYTIWQISRVRGPMSEEERIQAMLEDMRRRAKEFSVSEEKAQEIITQMRSSPKSSLAEEEIEAIVNTMRENIKK